MSSDNHFEQLRDDLANVIKRQREAVNNAFGLDKDGIPTSRPYGHRAVPRAEQAEYEQYMREQGVVPVPDEEAAEFEAWQKTQGAG